jgi:hypothetical protein
MTTAHETFTLAYNKITNEVPFSEEFHNGTGYFNALVDFETGLEVGERFKLVTPMPNNRKIIGVVTPVGNAVFFERYTAGEGGVICRNVPTAISGLFRDGNTSEESLWTAIGSAEGYNRNIGHMLKAVVTKAAGKGFMDIMEGKPADLN